MDIPKDYIDKFKVKKTSERAEILRSFIENIKDKSGKPFNPAFLGMKLAHIKTPELYYLRKQCEQAKNYGAMFWYLIQVK